MTAILVALGAGESASGSRELEELYYILLRRSFQDDPETHRLISYLLGRRRDSGSRGDRLRLLEQSMDEVRRMQAKAAEYSLQQEGIRQAFATEQREAHLFFSLLSMGLDLNNVRTPRFIPIRIYLRNDQPRSIEIVEGTVRGLLAALGFVIADEFPAERGSWWHKLFAKSKDVLTQPELQLRLQKLERALELQGLHKPQAEVDKNLSEAVRDCSEAIKDQPHACIQIGSLLYLKTTNAQNESIVQVRQLSQKQLVMLENCPEMLQSPSDALRLLGEAGRSADGLQSGAQPS